MPEGRCARDELCVLCTAGAPPPPSYIRSDHHRKTARQPLLQLCSMLWSRQASVFSCDRPGAKSPLSSCGRTFSLQEPEDDGRQSAPRPVRQRELDGQLTRGRDHGRRSERDGTGHGKSGARGKRVLSRGRRSPGAAARDPTWEFRQRNATQERLHQRTHNAFRFQPPRERKNTPRPIARRPRRVGVFPSSEGFRLACERDRCSCCLAWLALSIEKRRRRRRKFATRCHALSVSLSLSDRHRLNAPRKEKNAAHIVPATEKKAARSGSSRRDRIAGGKIGRFTRV